MMGDFIIYCDHAICDPSGCQNVMAGCDVHVVAPFLIYVSNFGSKLEAKEFQLAQNSFDRYMKMIPKCTIKKVTKSTSQREKNLIKDYAKHFHHSFPAIPNAWVDSFIINSSHAFKNPLFIILPKEQEKKVECQKNQSRKTLFKKRIIIVQVIPQCSTEVQKRKDGVLMPERGRGS
jgi:hypothetical protein